MKRGDNQMKKKDTVKKYVCYTKKTQMIYITI